MTEIDDDIWKLDCALRADVEALIKRAIASLPTDEAITFLYGMHEAAGLAMSELEDEQRNARQDVIYGLLDQAGNDGR